MGARLDSKAGWPAFDFDSADALKFWEQHGDWLEAGRREIDKAFHEHRGSDVFLFDICLRGLLARIVDGVVHHQLVVEKTD